MDGGREVLPRPGAARGGAPRPERPHDGGVLHPLVRAAPGLDMELVRSCEHLVGEGIDRSGHARRSRRVRGCGVEALWANPQRVRLVVTGSDN